MPTMEGRVSSRVRSTGAENEFGKRRRDGVVGGWVRDVGGDGGWWWWWWPRVDDVDV
jgi:hypothetical protein